MADPQVPRLPWASVSISAASTDGFSAGNAGRVTTQLAEQLLNEGYRLAFGHDWRDDGLMHGVASCASTAGRQITGTDDNLRMLNLVPAAPSDLSGAAQTAMAESNGAFRVISIRDLAANPSLDGLLSGSAVERSRFADLPDGWHAERPAELWVLRAALTHLLEPGIRICVGGATAGYAGCYAGIAEEAYLALATGKPLYLVGGFGGAAAQVAEAIQGSAARFDALRPSAAAVADGAPPILATVAAITGMPLDGLQAPLASLGVAALARHNGLDPAENAELFACNDIARALELIQRGAGRVIGGR